jgi:imidazolonepropionase-like amidohydrolase
MEKKPGGCLRLFLILTILFMGISGGSVWVILQSNRYTPANEAVKPLVFQHIRVFTGKDTLAGLQTLVLVGDSIACLGTDCAPPAGATLIDGTGLTALPGLNDLGFHFYLPTKEGFELSDTEQLIEYLKHRPSVRQSLLAYGITTSVSAGDMPGNVFSQKKALDNDNLEGPYLLAVGPEITVAGGYPAATRYAEDPVLQEKACRFVKNATEVREVMQALAKEGADGFRIIRDGGAGLPAMDEATFAAALDEAKRLKKWAYVRTAQPEGLLAAARGGAALLDYGGTAVPPDTQLREIAASGALVWLNLSERDSANKEALPALVQALRANGVALGAGSGWQPSAYAGEGLYKEMEALVRAGADPVDLLRSNTSRLFALTRTDHCGGLLLAGLRSDVIVCAGNPLAGPPYQPVWVIHKGRVVKKPKS